MRNLLLSLLILGFISCKKDKSDNTISFKPYKVIQITNDNQDTSYFTYNGVYPLVIESGNQHIDFEYESNKLIKKKVFRKGDDIPWMYQGYEYNTQNQIVKMSFNINVNSTAENWTGEKIDSFRLSAYYGYEYEGTKMTKEYYYDNATKDTTFYSIIKFDSNENIISKTEYGHYMHNYIKRGYSTYVYDTKHHYCSNIYYPAFFGIFSTVNNILIEKKTDYDLTWDNESGMTISDSTLNIINYIIDYNEFDYPISITSDDLKLEIEYY